MADNPEKPGIVSGSAEQTAPARAAAERPGKLIPELALLGGWFIPGLGHYYIGERRKAGIFFICLVAGFAFGAAVSKLECLSFTEHYYAVIAQLGIGILTLPVVLYKHFTGTGATDPNTVNTLMDPGLLYTQVAGLLNFLVALDAYERAIALHSKGDEK